MNTAKYRLQALGLLDRSFKAATDEELDAAIEGLGDEHRAALDELVRGEANAERVRAAISQGRLDGTMENVALVLTDACLADCIDELGEHADHPSSEQLRDVLPTMVERHSKGITQIMLASTVLGEAPAANIIRDVLKHDDDLKLPANELSTSAIPRVRGPEVSDEDRAAIKAKRKELKRKKQEEARRRREQAAQAKQR